jgi:hypothetical protein
MNSTTATQTVTLVIASQRHSAPTITSAAPSAGTIGTPYSFTVAASGTVPFTFSASGLPLSGRARAGWRDVTGRRAHQPRVTV